MSDVRILVVASVRQWLRNLDGTGERRDRSVLAVISFVCSVGNIPLAAALWRTACLRRVISFIFALVTLPCCSSTTFLRHEAALRLFRPLLVRDERERARRSTGSFISRRWCPVRTTPASRAATSRSVGPWRSTSSRPAAGGRSVLGAQQSSFDVSRHRSHLRMAVNTSAPGATRHVEHVDYYFCSPPCAERFDQAQRTGVIDDVAGDAMDFALKYGATLGVLANEAQEPSLLFSSRRACLAFLSERVSDAGPQQSE